MLNIEALRVKEKTRMPQKAKGRPDNFQTEDYAVDVLFPFLKNTFPESRPVRVWECAAWDGNMVRRLTARGCDVHASDKNTGVDFLTVPFCEWPNFDVVVTNPPYQHKDEFLHRCYETAKPFALLLPITALGEQGRVGMYAALGGVDIILPRRRIVFTTPSGKNGGAWFFAAWFTRGLVSRPAGCKNGQIVIA